MIKYKYHILFSCALLYLILGVNYMNASLLDVTRNNLLNYISKQIVILSMGISASIFIILIFHEIEKILNKKLCRIGMFTLEIYVCQSIFIETILSHFVCYDRIKPIITYIIIFPTIIILTLMLTVGYTKTKKVICQKLEPRHYVK